MWVISLLVISRITERSWNTFFPFLPFRLYLDHSIFVPIARIILLTDWPTVPEHSLTLNAIYTHENIFTKYLLKVSTILWIHCHIFIFRFLNRRTITMDFLNWLSWVSFTQNADSCSSVCICSMLACSSTSCCCCCCSMISRNWRSSLMTSSSFLLSVR